MSDWGDRIVDWKIKLLMKIMTRCLIVQANHKSMMLNVTETDAIVPDELIHQGIAEFGAELEQLLKEEIPDGLDQEMTKIKEERKSAPIFERKYKN
jgi:hypothetical protein|tara:strand:- start:11564 stop:11851 length:288 start_codon:yes stop_codon:yes gene_type:complete